MSSFVVLGQTITVDTIYDPASIPRTWETTAMGGFDLGRQSVFVKGDLGSDQTAETLLHEALHAIFSLGNITPLCRKGNDEPIVNALAPQLLHFIRQNPEFIGGLAE